jgi:hypothetical protein
MTSSPGSQDHGTIDHAASLGMNWDTPILAYPW